MGSKGCEEGRREHRLKYKILALNTVFSNYNNFYQVSLFVAIMNGASAGVYYMSINDIKVILRWLLYW